MSKTVSPIINELFAGRGESPPVQFEWRLIRRHGQPFLLLPCAATEARTGLSLYSAQRKRAKIWRRFLPALFRTPLAGAFEHLRLPVDPTSEMMQFMAQQAGVPVDRVFPMAIKLSDCGTRSRLVLLLCDESGRPARVIKVGLNAAGREATDREADFLAQLPADKIGCIRMTGRLSTRTLSAFATDYFPGLSPDDDAGMEHLFHAWLNPDAPVPLASLPIWQELTAALAAPKPAVWERIRTALAGTTVHTTLYHGDFAPWNVRVVNSRNLQAFDWERGSRQGIPGWDWFHFTIQTSILARRCSAARAAAEVEQLIHSPRFKQYAAAAGISDIVQPLVLAYLLHHKCVIQPQEGGETTAELCDLLAAHWLLKPSPAAAAETVAPAPVTAPGLWASARRQLHSASQQWSNLFWEPSLNSKTPPSWRSDFRAHWPYVLVGGVALAVIVTLQSLATPHLVFTAFYVAACALLTWRAGRRWGALAAVAAALIAPLVAATKDAGFREPEVFLWNTTMRFIIFEMCVLFVDRINKQRGIVHHRPPAGEQPAALAGNWAVMLACVLFWLTVLALDCLTNPHLIFLPLYLLPCMMVTLVFNLRWGLAAALFATSAATWIEYVTNKLNNYTFAEVFGWNIAMRLAVCVLVLVLLDRIRKENILFINRKSNGG